jgi:hypothetical protein
MERERTTVILSAAKDLNEQRSMVFGDPSSLRSSG